MKYFMLKFKIYIWMGFNRDTSSTVIVRGVYAYQCVYVCERVYVCVRHAHSVQYLQQVLLYQLWQETVSGQNLCRVCCQMYILQSQV